MRNRPERQAPTRGDAALRPARESRPDARAVHARHARRLRGIVSRGILELTGGSSVPGALTLGDVDLHLRVPAADFARAVRAVSESYAIVHPGIWTDTLATFADRQDPGVGLAVTPIGSVHDRRFVAAWDRLRRDAAALAAYNALKERHVDDPTEYERAKSSFFDDLVGDAEAGAASYDL